MSDAMIRSAIPCCNESEFPPFLSVLDADADDGTRRPSMCLTINAAEIAHGVLRHQKIVGDDAAFRGKQIQCPSRQK